MKKLYVFIFSLIVGSVMAQTQIPEGGLNNWTPSTLNTYYEPTGGWWTTLNTLTSLGGPATVSRTTDVHSGAYAARMETKQWGSFLLSGLMVSGNFIMTAPFIKQGKPFTDKPLKYKGWYKYTPVSGDSAGIVALLTKFNTISGKQDTIARAIQVVKNNVSVYTQFDLNFDYSVTGINPDTIIVVFASSADGANFNGQVGSTLFIDDVSLEYATGLQENLIPDFTINAYPSPASDHILLEFNTSNSEQLICSVYAFEGRLMESFTPFGNKHILDISKWQKGTYIVQARLNGSLVSSSKFSVIR